jgi:bifunctional N-acetylglucosamine-1-phosphate-uridyltransferase/glucosamine-1-phosphate-acetyltransferase GlmU-like protein
MEAPDPQEVFGINSRLDLAQAGKVLQSHILKRFMLEGVTLIVRIRHGSTDRS